MEGFACKSVSEVCRACEIIGGVQHFFRFLLCGEKLLGYGGVKLAMERACSIREAPSKRSTKVGGVSHNFNFPFD